MAERVITVQEGQNILDVAIGQYGTLEALFSIFVSNPGLDINQDLVAGQQLVVDSDGVGDQEVKAVYSRISYITNNADNGYTPDEGNYIWQDGNDYIYQNGIDNEFN